MHRRLPCTCTRSSPFLPVGRTPARRVTGDAYSARHGLPGIRRSGESWRILSSLRPRGVERLCGRCQPAGSAFCFLRVAGLPCSVGLRLLLAGSRGLGGAESRRFSGPWGGASMGAPCEAGDVWCFKKFPSWFGGTHAPFSYSSNILWSTRFATHLLSEFLTTSCFLPF